MAKAYSWNDVVITIAGPGGVLTIGKGTGGADGGVKITQLSDVNVFEQGLGDTGMHHKQETSAKTIEINMLAGSDENLTLRTMYNVQKAGDSAVWGVNVITIKTRLPGSTIGVYNECAFRSLPEVSLANQAAPLVWTFDVTNSVES